MNNSDLDGVSRACFLPKLGQYSFFGSLIVVKVLHSVVRIMTNIHTIAGSTLSKHIENNLQKTNYLNFKLV